MGQVYRARDTKLDRDVVLKLKVLPHLHRKILAMKRGPLNS